MDRSIFQTNGVVCSYLWVAEQEKPSKLIDPHRIRESSISSALVKITAAQTGTDITVELCGEHAYTR